MEDLSHWDIVEDFSAEEAAALIAGVDMDDPNAKLHKSIRALERVRGAYEIARKFVAGHPMTPKHFHIWRASRLFEHSLASVRVESYPFNQKAPWPGNPERDWDLPISFRGEYGDFEQQRFTRTELYRWLSVIGLKSVYAFEPQREADVPIPLANGNLPETASIRVGPLGASDGEAVAESASAWTLISPRRIQGYAWPLCEFLKAAYAAGKPCPTARDVLEAWRIKSPQEVLMVLPGSMDYYNAKGGTKTANLEAIGKAIGRMTKKLNR